jgi:beta-xylosidase
MQSTLPALSSADFPWARGIENQRRAARGDGTFVNPIIPGDHPDPTVLADGGAYYATFSSFDAYPGLVLWRSTDLVNWSPLAPTLHENVGSVWAPELVKHDGRYFIYFHARTEQRRSIYVIYAKGIAGPWSEPIDLNIPRIDPGHAVGEDGKRYLFLSGGDRVRLSDDGLSTAGPIEHVYDGWKYPEDWVVESFSQEGPKIVKQAGYYYMVLAEGGTAGPPTGHMVVVARSRSIHGPWENAPNNPVVRTRDSKERWWSKGHATLVQAPNGDWYFIYHAYENQFHTLGRQVLLEPVRFSPDGWIESTTMDVAAPQRMPLLAGQGNDGLALSDDFTSDRMGIVWSFYKGGAEENLRVQRRNGTLELTAKGSSPSNSSPLGFVVGDLAYEVEVEVELDPKAQGGLLLFYNSRLYAGLGVNADSFVMHRYGQERKVEKPSTLGSHFHLKLRNDRNILTLWYGSDGRSWTKFEVQMEVSGYHHNVAYDFLSLRPALYAAGEGKVRFRRLQYRAL